MMLLRNRRQPSRWNNRTVLPEYAWAPSFSDVYCTAEPQIIKTYNTSMNFYNKGNVMFRVRVHKIESIRDLDGNLGKRVELIEDRQIPSFVLRPQTEEAKVVQDVMQALQQQFSMFPTRGEVAVPKMILFLTEQEYETLGIGFDVNQIYDINLENQGLRFTRTA